MTSGWQLTAGTLRAAQDPAGFVSLAADGAAEPARGGWSQEVPVEAGASYYVAYRARSEKLAGSADLWLSFYDAQGQLLRRSGLQPISGDTPWTTCAWRCRAPAGARCAELWLGVEGATTGQAAFDWACLGPDDAPLARALIVDYARESGTLTAWPGIALDSQPFVSIRAIRGRWGLGAIDPTKDTNGTESPLHVGEASPPWPVAVTIDLAATFPNPLADPADPTAYDWRPADATLSAAAGSTEILCRLGNGAALPMATWAEVARRCVARYGQGRYPIRYWEVAADSGEPYERLLGQLRALEAVAPALAVGGPGLDLAGQRPYLEGLLACLAENEVRPGFLSWQSRAEGSPWAVVAAEQAGEQLLERYGLGDADLLSDWSLPDAGGDASRAAQLAAGWAYVQDTRLARTYVSAPALTDGQGRPTAAGAALQLLAGFQDTPRRLAATGGDELGFALLAARSNDGRRVHILIADSGSRSREYRLALSGFPPGYRYAVREISEGHSGGIVAEGDAAGLCDGVLIRPWRSPAVEVIEVEWGEGRTAPFCDPGFDRPSPR